LQHCTACGHDQLYPRVICTKCFARDLVWQPASGRGAVYSVTVVRRAPSPAYAEDVPYVIALIDLDEGPRIMANVLGCPPEDVSIGQRVRIDFDDKAEGVRVPRFQPEEDSDGD
jgi:uncharacterized OB-fold protein